MKVWSSVLVVGVVAIGVSACSMGTPPEERTRDENVRRVSQPLCKDGTACYSGGGTGGFDFGNPSSFDPNTPPPPPPKQCVETLCSGDVGGGNTVKDDSFYCPIRPEYQCGKFLWHDPELDELICAESCCPKEDDPSIVDRPGCGDSYYVPWNPCGALRWYTCTPYGWCYCA